MKLINIPEKPIVDYRQLPKLGLNSPEFRHLKLLVGWVIYFILYALTEHLIPLSACHEVHCRLDDMIPFTESFVIWYCSWFLLVFFSLLFFMRYDIEGFKRLQIFIMITQAIAMAIYICWPSIQHMRPQSFDHQNVFTWVLSIIYWFDTPTGIMPSLHVAYTMGIVSTWFKFKGSTPAWKVIMTVWFILISLSTLFIKQHSAIDVMAALPLGLFAEFLIYGIKWKKGPLSEEERFNPKRSRARVQEV